MRRFTVLVVGCTGVVACLFPDAAPAQPATPIPPVTDGDRAAAFPDVEAHAMQDSAVHAFVLVDQLEWHGRMRPGTIDGGTGNDRLVANSRRVRDATPSR